MKDGIAHRLEDGFIRIASSDFRPYEKIHLKRYSPHKHDRGEYTYSSDNFWVQVIFESRLWRVFEHLKNHQSRGRVLDIGCGEGLLLLNMANLFNKCVGIDLHTEAAEKFVADFKLPNVSLMQGEFREAVLESNSFDVVTATDVLEHVWDLPSFIKRVKEILKPGGLFLITIPSENFFYRIGRKVFGFSQNHNSCPHLHNAEQIISVLKKEFEIVEKEYVRINFLSNLWHKREHKFINSIISRLISAFYLVKMKR